MKPDHFDLDASSRYLYGTMVDGSLQVRLDVGIEPDADAAELDDATLALRAELLELDVDRVDRPASGPPTEGAKAVEAAIVGTLVVTAGKELIAAIVRTAERFVSRGKSRSIKMQLDGDMIEISDPSAEDQHRLIKAFLARHGEVE